MGAVVEEERFGGVRRPELAPLEPAADGDDERDLGSVDRAPHTLTRPWMSVPSIVKKRLAGFSIGLV